MPGPIGRIHWGTAEQVHAAEHALLRILTRFQYSKKDASFYLAAVRSLESLARLNARVTPFEPETVTRLSRIVAGAAVNDEEPMREAALAALIAARALDTETELVALKDSHPPVRRLATTVLAGAGAGLEEERRQDAIQERLADRDGQVRYEAVKAYARRNAAGAWLFTAAGSHQRPRQPRRARGLDALGDICKEDERRHDANGRGSVRTGRPDVAPRRSRVRRPGQTRARTGRHVDGRVRHASIPVGADVCRPRRQCRGRRDAAREAGLRHERQRPRGCARAAAPAEEGGRRPGDHCGARPDGRAAAENRGDPAQGLGRQSAHCAGRSSPRCSG